MCRQAYPEKWLPGLKLGGLEPIALRRNDSGSGTSPPHLVVGAARRLRLQTRTIPPQLASHTVRLLLASGVRAGSDGGSNCQSTQLHNGCQD